MAATIRIKPHHFADIIKLYGAGLERFVPDERMGHDFYRIGNLILSDGSLSLALTVDADDICAPCRYCRGGVCTDEVRHIDGYREKDAYNRMLDERIIALLSLDVARCYSARTLCGLCLEREDFIRRVWREEDGAVAARRHELFVAGAKKYLKRTAAQTLR